MTAPRNTRKPGFFIVGAPKSGTTAMTVYLREHPEVFMPRIKELHYFGSDLSKSDKYPSDLAAYLSWFKGAEPGQVVGECSVTYLYSRRAPLEIKEFNRSAKIIIMLRDPVDMMYALHSQLLFGGFEDISDFALALAAEPDRKQGRRIPKGAQLVDNLFYRDIAHYSEQVERYLRSFGRENVHIILHDDFRADTETAYRRALEFLGVDVTFRPEFRIVNPNKRVRSKLLRTALERLPVERWHGNVLIPPQLRWRLNRFNRIEEDRRPMDRDVKRDLKREFAPEVEQLARLLGRDLAYWSAA
jgi:hypothetical protein